MKSFIGFLLSLTLLAPAQANHDSTKWIDAELVEINLDELVLGEPKTYIWAGLPVTVLKPNQQQNKDLKTIPENILGDAADLSPLQQSIQQVYTRGYEKLFFQQSMVGKRAQAGIIVFIKLSPYLGCSPYFNKAYDSEHKPKSLVDFFHDPCRDVFFDISGRVIKGHKQKIQLNMVLPPYIIKNNKIIIGNSFGITKEELKSSVKNTSEQYKVIKNDSDLYDAIGHNLVEEIESYIIQKKLDLSQPRFLDSTVLSEALIQDHKELIPLFLKHGSSFDELTPMGEKIACALQYKPALELEKYYQLGLNPNKGYCKSKPNCFTPLIFPTATNQPITEVKQRIELDIKYGFDINKEYCGTSLVQVLKDNQRLDLIELIKPQIKTDQTKPQ